MTKSRRLLLLASLTALPMLLAHEARATVTGEWSLYANGAPGTPVNFTTNPMMNIQQGFCYFTHIQGEFEGGGEGGQILVGADGNWRMKVWAQQSGIGFRARCVTWDSFPNSANHTYTTVPRLDYAHSGYGTAVWGLDSICLLDLLTGQYSQIWQSAGTSSSSGSFFGGPVVGNWLNQGENNISSSLVESGTFCAYLGHQAHLALVPAGSGVNFDYLTDNALSTSDITMIGAGEGICWLNGIMGPFDGGGEQATVYIASDNHWHLQQVSQQPPWSTESMASCAYFK